MRIEDGDGVGGGGSLDVKKMAATRFDTEKKKSYDNIGSTNQCNYLHDKMMYIYTNKLN